jgi:phage tail tape-measure protein
MQMRKTMIVVLGTASMLFTSTAYAAVCGNAGGALGGAAAGAATGAVVGGPVGAAVGGVVGGAIGSQALPPTACSYVLKQDVPVVKLEKKVVVGEALPQTVVLHEIPETKAYVFAYVNDERVLVDPNSRVVVEVVQ